MPLRQPNEALHPRCVQRTSRARTTVGAGRDATSVLNPGHPGAPQPGGWRSLSAGSGSLQTHGTSRNACFGTRGGLCSRAGRLFRSANTKAALRPRPRAVPVRDAPSARPRGPAARPCSLLAKERDGERFCPLPVGLAGVEAREAPLPCPHAERRRPGQGMRSVRIRGDGHAAGHHDSPVVGRLQSRVGRGASGTRLPLPRP